jgi:hypothetical protein
VKQLNQRFIIFVFLVGALVLSGCAPVTAVTVAPEPPPVLQLKAVSPGAAAIDQTHQAATIGAKQDNNQVVVDLNESAALAARMAGVAEIGSIACDSFLIRCTCKGVFSCAWLAWACGEAGGIQGFEGECFFPISVPRANDAVNNFTSRVNGPQEAVCEGIFCSCTGPADSEDCQKITACIDDISCIGDSCGCIGGQVEE